MLRITSQNDPAGACQYFQAGHDYYLDGSEQRGVWGGKGAELLNLRSEIDPADFKALAYNRDPNTGEKLTARDHANRRVGYDFTFSVPKSVTLAYELLKDERILDAFKKSVAETMADIERDALTRDQRQGREDLVQAGNLTHATFIHRSSRPVNGVPDCQLHAHAFVFNAVKHNGRWTAVELGEVKANAPYYEALAMARLGKSLVDMGYGVRRKGKFFELEGVSDELVEKFSTRTKLIEAVAEAKGITNPDFKAELGGKTREHKSESHHTPEELRKLWIARLTPEDKHALKNLPEQEAELPTSREAIDWALWHAFERSAVVPEKKVLEHALRYGVGSVDLDGIKRAANQAGLLTKGERATTREMLSLEAGLIQWARDGRGTARPIRSGSGDPPRWPDQSSAQGRNRNHFATLNAGQQAAIGSRTARSENLSAAKSSKPVARELNAGQRAAVRHILKSQDRVTLVRGAAGVGKTTALEVAADGIREAGLPVQAIAISAGAAEQLEPVDPGAATVARFLIDERMQDAVAGGVVILDEASLIGTRQSAKLVKVLDRIDARLVMVGDVKQHSAVEAGSPFRAMQEYASLPVAEISEVMRQKGLYKWVTERLSRHEVPEALDLLEQMGHVHEADYTERMRLIVGDYLDAVHNKQSVLVVAPTHEEGNAVTVAIRDALKREGRIGDDEKEFTRLVPLNLTGAELQDGQELEPGDVLHFHRASGARRAGEKVSVAEWRVGKAPDDGGRRHRGNHHAPIGPSSAATAFRPSSIHLAPGDAVRITANGKDKSGKHKLKNGSVYAVMEFTRDGDIRLDNGWVLEKDFGHLAHGYVSTSHSSQGKTVDVVLVSESTKSFPAASAEQFYVSISRGKQAAYVYTDNVEELREAVAKARPKELATDLMGDRSKPKKPGRVKSRVAVVQRIKGIAEKAKQQVRQLTKPKEKQNEHQWER